MLILAITSAAFVVLAILLILIRIHFERRVASIEKETDQPLLFRRKLNYLKRVEQTNHIRYLLLTCLMIGLSLLLIIGSFLVLEENHQKQNVQNTEMKERILKLEKQQSTLIASIPLKVYPEEGIGLKDYEWEKLARETNDSNLQKQIESAISQTTLPYFGSSDIAVSLSVPKKLSLQLRGQTDDNTSKKMIQRNIDAFVEEVERTSDLTDIHVRMVTSIGKEKQVVYSVNYSRANDEDQFNKKNVFEQNLKNDGGKG